MTPRKWPKGSPFSASMALFSTESVSLEGTASPLALSFTRKFLLSIPPYLSDRLKHNFNPNFSLTSANPPTNAALTGIQLKASHES